MRARHATRSRAIDDTHLAVWGYGQEDDWHVDAMAIHDVTTGARVRWFAGPRPGDPVFDRHLYMLWHEYFSVWDIARGARLFHSPTPLTWYHPGAKTFIARSEPGAIELARLCGEHADATWNTGRVRDVARAIAGDLEAGLPVLADALEAAGCDDEALLAHCRAPGPHGRHCWALDRLG